MSAAPRVLMYSTAVCPLGVRSDQLLRARGVSELGRGRVDLVTDRRALIVHNTAGRDAPALSVVEYIFGRLSYVLGWWCWCMML